MKIVIIIENKFFKCYNNIRKYVLLMRYEKMMENIYEDNWIGIEEAANYIGVNKDTVRNWIKKETDIPAHRVGKLWKFKN